ncbi:MAG: ABC transporter substrate-binding protein [Smithellaceae bacterium]|jgi:branched-chain amino acid transport system substrate-binding protein
MKLFKMVGCLAVLVAALFFWCNSSQAKDVVIGFTAPLSGPAAEYGLNCASGLDMAVKQINKTGGIKIKGKTYNLKLVKLDDGMDPTRAVTNSRRLQEQDHAVAIFSPITASQYAMMTINREKGHEFIVMAYTSSPALSKQGNELTVTIPPTFSIYAEVEAKWAYAKGYRRAGVIVTNEVYGVEWTDFFSKYFTKLGGEITAVKPANMYTETDFSAQISAILATKPDVMLVGGPSATSALMVEQARNLGYKGAFCFIDQAQIDQMANVLKGYQLMYNSIAVGTVVDLPAAITPWFVKTFKENYKGMYTWEVALHYGAALAVARAVQAAGSTDVLAIRKAFPKAYPLLGDQVPAQVHGLTSDGRQLMLCSTQTINQDGKLERPILEVWWPKTKKEFNAVVKLGQRTLGVSTDPNIPPVEWVWMEAEDYRK